MWRPRAPAPGHGRARQPVATISRSYATTSPSARARRLALAVQRRSPARRGATRVERVARERAAVRRRAPPASSSLDSGGRVYGQVRLVADHDQLAVEARGARGLRGAQPGQRRADDDEPAHRSALDPDRHHRAGVDRLLDGRAPLLRRRPPSRPGRRRRRARTRRAPAKTHSPWLWQRFMSTWTFMRCAPLGHALGLVLGDGERDVQRVGGRASCSPASDRSTSQSTTVFSTRPSPLISTATTSPGSIGRELAGVPVSTTSPGSSVISAAQVGELVGDAPDQVVGRRLLHDLAVEVRAQREVGRVELGRRARPRGRSAGSRPGP